MMKMRIAAVLAAVMIGTAALPAATVFAQGNDPEQTTAAETAAAPETTAVTETAETDAKDEELDPEVLEVLLKNPKLMAYLLPTLHVTVTDTSVTVAVDGDEPEEDPVRTGHVRTNGSNLNVRTGPGIGFDIINSLANGTEVQVMKEENGWYQLEFPAKYGYVCWS